MVRKLKTWMALGLSLFSYSQAHALESCHYQHLGIRSGAPYSPNDSNFLGDIQEFNRHGHEISFEWLDPVTALFLTVSTKDSQQGEFCQVDFKLAESKSKKSIGWTSIILPSKDCGRGANIQSVIPIPESIVQKQLANRVNNQGPVYDKIQFACFGE